MDTRRWLITAAIISIYAIISACGSGLDSAGSNPIPYTGSTEPAVINSANAAGLLKLAYDTGSAGAQVTNAVSRSFDDSRSSGSSTGRSNCTGWSGGYYTITSTTSPGETPVRGRVDYSGYCYIDDTEDIIINGVVSYDLDYFGTDDLLNYYFYPVDIMIRNSANAAVKNDFTLGGNMEVYVRYLDSSTSVTGDFTVRDNMDTTIIPLPIYKVKSFVTELKPFAGTLSSDVGGSFSHPVEGVVTVSTVPELIYTHWLLPDSGVFKILGAGGSGARVDFEADPSLVEIDTDGDGGFDNDTDTIIW